MKATVGKFNAGYRITLSGLNPTEVNRIRRVLEHAARGQAWDGGSTRSVAMEAANAISKALKVENGQFFITEGEALSSAPAKGDLSSPKIVINYSDPAAVVTQKKLIADMWKAIDKPW